MNVKSLTRLNDYLNESDFLESAIQVVISISLLFLPFAIMSWVSLEGETYSHTKHWCDFVKFFSRGELGISVFGVTGAVLYILLRKLAPMGAIASIVFVLVFLAAFLIVAILLGSNPGFKDILPTYKLNTIFWCFVVMNLLWFVVSWQSGKQPNSFMPPPDQAQRDARQLAQQARGDV